MIANNKDKINNNIQYYYVTYRHKLSCFWVDFLFIFIIIFLFFITTGTTWSTTTTTSSYLDEYE